MCESASKCGEQVTPRQSVLSLLRVKSQLQILAFEVAELNITKSEINF